MLRQPPLRSRVRDATRRVLSRATHVAAAVASLALRVAPGVLAAGAVVAFAVQPVAGQMDRDALIAIAGIVSTVLALGLTVTLLVAQHTAERHARVLYEEFRREHSWLLVLGLLGFGVILIVAASLLRPTVATGWAALAATLALGLYAASRFPPMLDSLDPTMLAERVTDRTVRHLRKIVHDNPRYPDPELKPVAERGLDIASGMAIQGIASNDSGVVRAGFAGMRRVLVAYIEGSSTRGWDAEIINLAFQHLDQAVNRCVKESPVLLLRVALEELTLLASESQHTLEPGGNEAMSGRLNSLLLDVVRGTMLNDQSPGAAMATGGIGAGAQALIRAESPNMVADHIRKLRVIALGSLKVEKDHVAGQAHVELARIAVVLASMRSRDIMPPSLYQDACAAIGDSVDAFVERGVGAGGMADDWAWNSVTMSHMETNLARVVIAGIRADSRHEDPYRRDFGHGAAGLVQSLLRLGTEGTGGFTTGSHAIETAYMAVLGAMAVGGEGGVAEFIPEMWRNVVRRLLDPGKEKGHEVDMLSRLLVVAAYEAESSQARASAMKKALEDALEQTAAIEDEWHRRRRARAWLGAGRATLACGDEALAVTIAKAIAPDLRDRNTGDGRPWRMHDDWFTEVFAASQSASRPPIPTTHAEPEVVAAFEVLLKRHERRRRRRRATTGAAANGATTA